MLHQKSLRDLLCAPLQLINFNRFPQMNKNVKRNLHNKYKSYFDRSMKCYTVMITSRKGLRRGGGGGGRGLVKFLLQRGGIIF